MKALATSLAPLALAALVTVSTPDFLVGQDALRAAYDSAEIAWRRGDYVDALERLERVLRAPGGERFLAAAALLTGELYPTVEVAPDGRGLGWSPDGRYAKYMTGSGAEVTTQLVAVEGGQVRAAGSVQGTDLVFSPDGRQAAYRAIQPSRALEAARVEAQQRFPSRDDASRARLARELARLDAEHARLMTRDLTSGREREVATPRLGVYEAIWGSDSQTLYFVGNVEGDSERTDVFAAAAQGQAEPRRITEGPGLKRGLRLVLGGTHLAYGGDGGRVALHDLASGESHIIDVLAAALSADGTTMVYVQRDAQGNTINVISLRKGAQPVVVTRSTDPVASPALSLDGTQVAYQRMSREDWELYVVNADGTGERRLTWDIQHDLFPVFLTPAASGARPRNAVLAVMGEARHRRSYLYDADSGERLRLFHNNTVRTVAPEYEWAASPDGTRVLIVADRDGNTISPERGVYLMDLGRRLTRDDVLARLGTMLAAERDLRERGRAMFEPVTSAVQAAVDDVSVEQIYRYADDLYRFGSKHITQPGNARAIEYLAATLRSFGYEPELQWFEPRPGVRTANVIARLRGTVHPDATYVVSSHFDSVERGPGADDDTSGTTALLEAARVLARRPQSATIEFGFFTGEEAGLLGSREYVRLAVANGKHIVGALNNDMIGFANDERLDNTIRYSNAGIRDLQHAAAFLFTDLITYDSKYYRSTDAAAYYEAYGDIVGGIGSYPILGNPHYHQAHDVLETVNQRLVAAVSGTTVASIMLMASSPSRLTGLEVERQRGSEAAVRWSPAVERDVVSYQLAYGPPADPGRHEMSVTRPQATLPDAPAGTVVAVRAVNQRGLPSWDWARITLGAAR